MELIHGTNRRGEMILTPMENSLGEEGTPKGMLSNKIVPKTGEGTTSGK